MPPLNDKETNCAKTVLVTGASRGIGKAIALKLATEGYKIVIHYHKSKNKAEDILKTIESQSASGRILQFDISNREECRAALENDLELHGVYYGVVCNAGITADNPFPALSEDDWDSVLNTNLNGFFNVLQPLVMPMVQARNGGRIVTISSVSGLTGNRGQVNYSAAKAGIIGASKALALELAKRQITVNCIAPGLIETDMLEGAPVEEIIKMIPLRRIGKPEEVASLAAYLMSEGAAYITRQVISVNGGLV